MNVPCEECICLPICRHKNYSSFINDCSIVKWFFEFPFQICGSRDKSLEQLVPVVKPTSWYTVSRDSQAESGGILRVVAVYKNSNKSLPWLNQVPRPSSRRHI